MILMMTSKSRLNLVSLVMFTNSWYLAHNPTYLKSFTCFSCSKDSSTVWFWCWCLTQSTSPVPSSSVCTWLNSSQWLSCTTLSVKNHQQLPKAKGQCFRMCTRITCWDKVWTFWQSFWLKGCTQWQRHLWNLKDLIRHLSITKWWLKECLTQ